MSEQLFQPQAPEHEHNDFASRLHAALNNALLTRGVAENDGYFLTEIFDAHKYVVINNYWTAAGNHSEYPYRIDDPDRAKKQSLINSNSILCLEIHDTAQEPLSYIVCRPADVRSVSVLHSMLSAFNPQIDLASESYDILSFPTKVGTQATEIDFQQLETIVQKIN